MQNDMLERAENIETITPLYINYEDFKDVITNKQGFVKAMWCGDLAAKKD